MRRRDQALLVQLADGVLSGQERARAEAIPDARLIVQRQRRVARALGAGLPPVPVREPARPAVLPRLALAGALAAVLVLLWVLVPSSGRSATEQAADIAKLPATQPAPAASGSVLRAEVDGVRFPEWGREFGWHETGLRRDEIDGRRTATVFYEHMGHRLAYTIVSGPPLPRPTDARVIDRDGLEISVYRDAGHGGHDVAVFERGGRTCVVAGHVLELNTLLKLAAWKGGGSLRS